MLLYKQNEDRLYFVYCNTNYTTKLSKAYYIIDNIKHHVVLALPAYCEYILPPHNLS